MTEQTLNLVAVADLPADSSAAKVGAALVEHGWQFTVEATDVKVPDHDNAWYRGSSSRAHVPTTFAPGFRITISNEVTGSGVFRSHVTATLEFTEKGAYLPRNVKGTYPIYQGTTLTKVLDALAEYSKRAIEARVAERDAESNARQQAYDAKVLAAYQEASQEVTSAQAEVAETLKDLLGLTDAQIAGVLTMVQTDGSSVSALIAAKTKRDRVGKGWLPGANSISGTYVNGVRQQ
jgi:hypothetical protein